MTFNQAETVRIKGMVTCLVLLLTILSGCTAPPAEQSEVEVPKFSSEDLFPDEVSDEGQSETFPDISRFDCDHTASNITAVKTLFAGGSASPSQTLALLDEVSMRWIEIAGGYEGSKSEWLEQMAALSDDLGNYISTGVGDGELLLQQLGNNFALLPQFC